MLVGDRRLKVLVLGGTGFIGRGLLEVLAADEAVELSYTLRNGAAGTLETTSLGRPVPIDDLDALDLSLARNQDVVIDLVSGGRGRFSPHRDILARTKAHCRIIDDLYNQKWEGHYIFLSSGGTIYGLNPPTVCNEDLPLMPTNDYSLEKAIIELHLHSVAARGTMSASVLRVANAIGEEQEAKPGFGVIPAIIAALVNRTPFELYGDADARRDYIHVSDVCRAIVLAVHTRGVGAVNIGSGTGTSIRDLLRICSQIAGRSVDIKEVPVTVPEPSSIVLGVGRAFDRLGWCPLISLEAALEGILARHKLSATLSC